MSDRNLWELGAKLAENPSMWTRVKHSSKGTSIRRVGKVSNIPKALAKGGAFVLKQVPIPVVRDILSAAVDKAYEIGKNYHRKKKQIDTATSSKDKTKFGWKEMNVQDMDRYRWKVVDSMKDLNNTSDKFSSNIAKYTEQGKVCDAFVRLTRDYSYACKRSKKLRVKALAILELTNQTMLWLDEVDKDLNKWVTNNRQNMTVLANVPAEGHENCEKTVCAIKDDVKMRLKHSKVAGAAQMVGNVVGGAFDPMEFISMSQPSDHQIKTDNMYTHTSY